MPVVSKQLSIRCPKCGVKTLVSYKAKIRGEEYTFEADQNDCPSCEADWSDALEVMVEEDIEDYLTVVIDKELEKERQKQFVEALENYYYDE
jgi:hypothetical protein